PNALLEFKLFPFSFTRFIQPRRSQDRKLKDVVLRFPLFRQPSYGRWHVVIVQEVIVLLRGDLLTIWKSSFAYRLLIRRVVRKLAIVSAPGVFDNSFHCPTDPVSHRRSGPPQLAIWATLTFPRVLNLLAQDLAYRRHVIGHLLDGP